MNRSSQRLVLALAAAFFGTGSAAAAETDAPHCVLPAPRIPGIVMRADAPLRTGGGPGLAPAATTGSIRLLVLLAEFSDLPHRITAARFEDHLFGPGPSMRTYYADVSGDQLDVTADVFGWYTLPRTEFSYSQGVGGLGGYPNNGQGLAEDAVAEAVAQGVDLSDYDADLDGVVDALLVVHSGEGFEWAGSSSPPLTPIPDPDAINSHKWVVVDGNFGSGLPRVVDYFTCPELQRARSVFFPAWTDSIATIGVFCHEFGHVLGLPDYYDTQTSASRVGVWDLMDSGIWSNHPTDPDRSLPGSLPAQFSAWSKMFFGWEEPVRAAPAVGEVFAGDFVVESASTGGAPLQLRANPFEVDWSIASTGSGEFFVAEARTQTGWDAGLPGAGLLVYHVDESRRSNRVADFGDGAGLLLLVPQDRSVGPAQEDDDPWPGFQSTLGPETNPSTDLHDGSGSGVSLSAITALPSGSVSLHAEVTNLFAALPIPFARPHPFRPALHGEVSLILSLDANPPPNSVSIFDIVGRRVREIATATPASRVLAWDGRDDGGRGVPAGVYFFRTSRGASGRVVLLRD